MTELESRLVAAYADTFRTYGPLGASHWFLGIEEGGGQTLEQIVEKLERRDRVGRKGDASAIETEFLTSSAECAFLPADGRRAKLQPTWAGQIRIQLGIEGRRAELELVRSMQTGRHGTKLGDSCLMELFPLPCRTSSSWIYGDIEPKAIFGTKRSYRSHYGEIRIRQIRHLAIEYRPAALVCLGWSHRDTFARLADGWQDVDVGRGRLPGMLRIGRLPDADTVVAICTHPTARVSDRNAFLDRVGREIAGRLPASVEARSLAA